MKRLAVGSEGGCGAFYSRSAALTAIAMMGKCVLVGRSDTRAGWRRKLSARSRGYLSRWRTRDCCVVSAMAGGEMPTLGTL